MEKEEQPKFHIHKSYLEEIDKTKQLRDSFLNNQEGGQNARQ